MVRLADLAANQGAAAHRGQTQKNNTYKQTTVTHTVIAYNAENLADRQGAAAHRGQHLQAGLQGFQGYGFHLSAHPFEIIRDMYGLIICVCLFLRIEAP